MANKREFKKGIDELGASLLVSMSDAYETIEGADKKAIEEAMQKVILAVEKARNNSNVFFDKGMRDFESHKEYNVAKTGFFNNLFKNINDELTAEIEEALKLFNSAIPQSVKDSLKENPSK